MKFASTVRHHLGRGNSKETKAPTGSDGVIQEVETASRSLCVQHPHLILVMLDQGLTAQRIHQVLCVEHGFTGRYSSVRRFVLRLQERSDLAFHAAVGELRRFVEAIRAGESF
ncbi:MAG: hypothetical protein U0939_14825 [Pirellulales bacterium]